MQLPPPLLAVRGTRSIQLSNANQVGLNISLGLSFSDFAAGLPSEAIGPLVTMPSEAIGPVVTMSSEAIGPPPNSSGSLHARTLDLVYAPYAVYGLDV